MGKKTSTSSSNTAQSAWSILRMALVWARKGGVFKRWAMLELRSLVPKYLKALSLHHLRHRDGSLFRHGERELSFDETPMFHVRMHRPASMRFLLPCITPQEIDFDYDFDDDLDSGSYGYYDECNNAGKCSEGRVSNVNGVKGEEEESGIDVRAEEFIAKFYEQMKLQRQISLLQYKESNSDIHDDKL